MMEHLLTLIISQLLPRWLPPCFLRWLCYPSYNSPLFSLLNLFSLLSLFLLIIMRIRPLGVAINVLTRPRLPLGPLNPFTAQHPVKTRFGPSPPLITAPWLLNSIFGLIELLLPLNFFLAHQDLHLILNAIHRLLFRWLLGLGPLADLLGVPMSPAPRP